MKVKTENDPGAGGERGQVIVLLAFAIIALVAAVGLATDGAIVYIAQRHLRRALDAAALAAANKLPDNAEAEAAAYQFMRLHGYDYDPVDKPLNIIFPVTDPPRKIATVSAGVDADLFFLNVVNWHTVEVNALGEGESAPLDVYLVLDLSNSMVYDTDMQPEDPDEEWPEWWNDRDTREDVCPQTGCPGWLCEYDHPTRGEAYDASYSWSACRAYYCNFEGDLEYPVGSGTFIEQNKGRNCDPLDVHIKDSAQFFVDQLDSRYDRIGVIGYDREGQVYQTLTDDFNAVTNTIQSMDAYEVTSAEDENAWLCTNIGDGLLFANVQMSQDPPVGGRIDSVWSTVLLTDGRANIYRDCGGCPDECGDPECGIIDCSDWDGYCAEANEWAINNAWSSWTLHKIVVYTIGYGQNFESTFSYRELMIDIADITDNGEENCTPADKAEPDLNGCTENFWAVPDEAGLREALAEIAERIYTRLLR